VTHDRKMDSAVSQEVVVKGRQIRSPRGNELEGCFDFSGNGGAPFDNGENILLLLVDLSSQSIKVLYNVGSALKGRGSSDVVESRILGQMRGVRSSKELQVHSCQGHDGGFDS